MVDLLEDPQKRGVFLKDLKRLIQTKELAAAQKKEAPEKRPEPKAKEAAFIAGLFLRFEVLSKKVVEAASSAVKLVGRVPETFDRAKVFLADGANRARIFRLLINIAIAIFIAFMVRAYTRKRMKQLTRRMGGLPSRIAFGFLKILLGLVPYVILLASFFLLFRFQPSYPLAHTLTLIFFLILLFYRLAIHVFQVLLSPDQSETRILSVTDENANYLWVWARRFIDYAVFYFLITSTLSALKIPAPAYAFIRGVLLIPFPLMISVFVLQIARELKPKSLAAEESAEQEGPQPIGSRKTLPNVIRYGLFLAVPYAWAIFIFLIVYYQSGFHYLFWATIWTGVTLLSVLAALQVKSWAFVKFFAVNERVKERFPGLEEKTNRYILILDKTVRNVLILIGLGTVGQIWGIPIGAFVTSKTGSMLIMRVVAIIVTLAVVLAVMEMTDVLSEYFLKARKRRGKKVAVTQKAKTLIPMIRTGAKMAAGFIGGIIVLDRLGVNTTPILAGAGIVGLAVGFGSQTLVKDLINGLFILFEESLRVGDYADLGKNQGIVEAVGLRTVKLRDVYGNVHVVPNSSIEALTNMSKEFSRAVLDIGVAYREDVDEVMEIMREVGEEMRNDPEIGKGILEPIEIFGLQKFDDSAVVIRARMTTKPLKQWGLKREFNRRIKKVFDARGIEIPFPHRTLYVGEPKEGPPAAMHVRLEQAVGADSPA
jgi:small conductance mechanosensitive channel